jgi:serine/threonine protein kinase
MASSSKRRKVPGREPSRLWAKLVEQADDKSATDTLLPVDLVAKYVSAIDDDLDERQSPPRAMRARTQRPEVPPARAEPGEFARRYRIQGKLDDGGMATVMVARQHALAREVAVKMLPPGSSQTQRLLFRAEALVTAYLEHPNIVPVYDAADDCLVMKRVRGGSLTEMIPHEPDLTRLAARVEVVLKACDAIAFAHSRGIIHRDVKADNVMVGEFGEVLVVDWGLALAIAPGPDGEWHGPRIDHCPSICAGTPGCVPPEVARGDKDDVGPHTDLHMLGGMLYQVLAGRMPFQHEDKIEALMLAAGNEFVPVPKLVPDAPRRLVEAQQRAMSFLPEGRGTVAEFAGELRAYLGREAVREAPATGAFHRHPDEAIGLAQRIIRRVRGR